MVLGIPNRQNFSTLLKLAGNILKADLDRRRTFGTLPASCGESARFNRALQESSIDGSIAKRSAGVGRRIPLESKL